MMKKISAILLFFVVVMSMTAKESGESTRQVGNLVCMSCVLL